MASVTEPTRTEPTRTERVIPVKPSNVTCTTTDTHPSEITPASYSPIPIESGTDLPVTHEHTSEDSVARRLVILGTVLFPLAGLIAAIIIASQYCKRMDDTILNNYGIGVMPMIFGNRVWY